MPRCPVCHCRVAGTKRCPRDAWLPPPSRALDAAQDPPPSLPGLTPLRLVGAGGFATVWEAARAEGGESVALKVGRWASPHTVERFRRDAEALERVGPPHVPRMIESGTLADGRPFIAMELLRGKTLAEVLAELEAPPGVAEVVATGAAILDALAAAHAEGVIHRDLKPENLLVADGGERLALLDFGLTKQAREPEPDVEGLTLRGTVVGTPEYMAPEQIRGDPIQDERTDVYAFGVILYELLTLRLPFTGDRGAIEHGHLALRPPRPHEFAAVPEELEKLVLACLAKEPERRPPDVAALKRALGLARPKGAQPAPSAQPARGALLTDGRQPAVVLVAEAKSAYAVVMSAVAARKGFVARQRGARLVCVFSGVDADDPVSAAIAVARESEERYAGRAALHVAGLIVRRKEQGPPAVYGAPVEQPDTWMPQGDWGGVVLTAELVRALPAGEQRGVARDPALARAPGAAFYRLAVRSSPPQGTARAAPLVGRDEVIGALAVSIEASMSGACPGLFTLLGEGGLGKSRLADEAASLVHRIGGQAQIIALRAAQPLAGERASTELLARVLDATPGAPPGDPRAFCAARLGEGLAEEAWRAVAAALGWVPPEETGASPWSLRQSTMRAIAEGLRRRAREGPVAVIVDDAHWADDAALDALEFATLDAPGCPLWVLVAAHPRFEEMRRSWGARAERHDRAALGRLPEQAAMRLAAELLRPAEYPPEAALRQLARWSGYNPSCLTELVRALKRTGGVQRRPTGTFYVATAALDQLPPLPAWQWLAARRLDTLSPELSACVRLCSVLGPDFTREEVEEIQDAIEQAGGASTPIDAGVGLGALCALGVLVRGERGIHAFESATFRDAVYDALAPAQRQTIHAHALAWWRARVEPRSPDRRGVAHLARHAAACGERALSAAAHLALGDRAMASHENVEADQRYTAALALLEEGDARRRAHALAGRGKARYCLHRIPEALSDLGLARGLARELGDDRLTAELLFEEATALDHATDYAGSARRAAEARAIVDRLGERTLQSRLLMALGRSSWRQQRVTEAIDQLDRAAAGAAAEGDQETRVIALLLLSMALVIAGRLGDAEARFCEVIALSKEMKDRLHLCSAYANRAYLWAALSAPERGLQDLSRAVELAREIGNPGPEHVATHNLAELLHWCGREDEALALARRSRVLAERFGERAAPDDALLIARIQAARGELEEAARLVAWVAERCSPDASAPAVYALLRMLRLVLAAEGLTTPAAGGDPADSWEALTDFAERTLPVEELLEVLYFHARVAASTGRHDEASMALDKARPALVTCRMWQPRFEAVAALLPARPGTPDAGASPPESNLGAIAARE